MTGEDWRVEIELEDEDGGFDVIDRLRSVDLDDEARKRLGPRVYASRNGPRVFLYSQTKEQAREAESVMRQLIAAHELTANFYGITRWHPVEQEWRDASIPLPGTPEEVREEYERREAAERREAEEQGSYDWVVKINLPGGDEAKQVAQRLEAKGHPVDRVRRWVTLHVLTEEAGNDVVASLEGELPEGSEIWLEANVDDPDTRDLPFVLGDPRMY